MSLPRLGLLHGGALAGVEDDLRERCDLVRVLPGEPLPDDLHAWLVGVPGLEPERVQRVRDGDTPALFVVEAADVRAWHRVLRRGLHDVLTLPVDTDDLRARLHGVIARRGAWTDVASALSREVAHDLRGPLQALQLTVTALTSDGAIGEGFEDDVTALLEAVDLADLMLDGVANLGRRPVATPDAPVDLLPGMRKVATRPAFGGRVVVSGGEALPVRVTADVLQAALEDVVRVVWIRAAGRRDVAVTCLRLGQEAVVTAQAKAYAALLDHLPALLSREKPVLLRRERVPMPLAGLAYARDVAVAAGGELTVRRAEADLVVELRLPLARAVSA